MKGAITRFGLETVSTPMIGPLWGVPPTSSARIGAATCITVLSSSSGSMRVLRAPYLPCRVRATSFQREWSAPVAVPAESKRTTPRVSVMVTR
ncbi:hypothetical protein D3C81_1017150 [compost metagenome]